MDIHLLCGPDPIQCKDGEAERMLSAGKHFLKGELVSTVSLVFVRVWQQTESTPDGSKKTEGNFMGDFSEGTIFEVRSGFSKQKIERHQETSKRQKLLTTIKV